MTLMTIPLEKAANQRISFVVDNLRWVLTLRTRLGKLYASVENNRDGVIIQNRVCLNNTPIIKQLVFIDLNGHDDPVYSGLNSRFFLVYNDEA